MTEVILFFTIWMNSLLRVHSLACCDCNHLIDVIYRTAAAEIVYRACNTLENRADSICIAESLNKLVGNVSYLEAWEYENIGMTGDF